MLFSTISDGKLVILIVFLDDIILMGDNLVELERLKNFLAKEFEIMDLGTLRYALGMEFARSKECIFVSQRKCTLALLKETGFLGCKPIETLIDPTCKLGLLKKSALIVTKRECVNKEHYQKLIGKLIYIYLIVGHI